MDSRERAALDRHITGNYGEDQIKDLTLNDLSLEAANISMELASAHVRQKRGEPIACWRESIAIALEDLAEQVRGIQE